MKLVLTEKEIIDSDADIHQLYAANFGMGSPIQRHFPKSYNSTPFFTDICMRLRHS